MTAFARAVRVLGFAAVPAAGLLLASPVASAIWDAPRLTLQAALMVSPFYIGLASAPGYLYLAYSGARAAHIGPGRRWWVRASLIGALVASLGGIWGGTMIFFLLPPSLVSAVAVVLLWNAFERRTEADPSRERKPTR